MGLALDCGNAHDSLTQNRDRPLWKVGAAPDGLARHPDSRPEDSRRSLEGGSRLGPDPRTEPHHNGPQAQLLRSPKPHEARPCSAKTAPRPAFLRGTGGTELRGSLFWPRHPGADSPVRNTTPAAPARGQPQGTRPLGRVAAETPVMIQITPHIRILVALEPVDFRRGNDGLAAVCR